MEHGLPSEGGERVCAWIEKFVVVPKGVGAGAPFQLRAWQRELIFSAFDGHRPRLGLWSVPRGNGKTALAAALGLYALHGDGVFGARVYVVARDERQARHVFDAAQSMTKLSPLLAKRSYLHTDKITVPGSDSLMQVLPAEARSLEGLDPSLAIIDEIEVVDRRTFEVMLDSMGKRPTSLLLCIGTPAEDRDSVMWDLRVDMLANPEDPLTTFTEFAAPAGCELDDEQAWATANPALGDFLFPDAVRAGLPPKTREPRFRRMRLGQWAEGSADQWMEPGPWGSRSTGKEVPDGAEVVLALDGSFSQDSTALVVATVSATPHLAVAGHWSNPGGDPDWRVDVLAVEQAIRAACKRWRVREVSADPYRWQRSLQVLGQEGLPVTEFPQSAARMTPATTGLHEAVTNAQVTHSGDKSLTEHVLNAVVTEDSRGTRIHKRSKNSARRIDLAVCAVMAWSRATNIASRSRTRRVVAW